MDRSEELSSLGAKSPIPQTYDPKQLEAFENAHPEQDYLVSLVCPEFTTLCPVTGQPDFATIYINYIPNKLMVESKSLKLYLFGFRNNGDFHEDVTNIIMKDLVKLMQPKYIEVKGVFASRGGIAIHPFANWAHPDFEYGAKADERIFEQMNVSY